MQNAIRLAIESLRVLITGDAKEVKLGGVQYHSLSALTLKIIQNAIESLEREVAVFADSQSSSPSATNPRIEVFVEDDSVGFRVGIQRFMLDSAFVKEQGIEHTKAMLKIALANILKAPGSFVESKLGDGGPAPQRDFNRKERNIAHIETIDSIIHQNAAAFTATELSNWEALKAKIVSSMGNKKAAS